MTEFLRRHRGGAGLDRALASLRGASPAAAVLALLLFLAAVPGSAQPITIDDFTTGQATLTLTYPPAGTTASSSAQGGGMLGGERDLEIDLSGGTAAGDSVSAGVASGAFSYSQGATITGSGRIVWDGMDGDPTVNPFGLGGLDLTVGHTQDGLLLELLSNDQPVLVEVEVFTDDLHASAFAFTLGVVTSATPFVIPYAAFTPTLGSGADFTSVGAVTLTLGTEASPASAELGLVQTTASLSAAETVALVGDVDGDGQVDPGDTLRYTVVVSNAPSPAIAETGVTFTQSAPGNTTLVTGSVTTTQGTVATGNTSGDTDVAVALGTLDSGTNATIQFDVVVDDPLAAGVTQIVAQGVVGSDTLNAVLTDDPAVGGTQDPTVIPVAAGAALDATEAAALAVDANGNGEADPGDVVEYTVVVTNSGGQGAGAASFANAVDPNASLVAGSVTTTQGTVTEGNTPGDDSVAVFFGTLPGGGGTVTVTFRVTVDNPLPPGVNEIVSQGTVTAQDLPSIVTDDPSTPAIDDPTRFPVVSPPPVSVVEVPTLDEWGLLALVLALGAAVLTRLRRAEAAG